MGRSAPISGSALPQWPPVGARPTPYMTHPVAGLAHVLVPATAAPSEAHGGRGAFVIHGVGRPWALCVEHKWPRTMYPHQSGPLGQAAAGPRGGAACLAQTPASQASCTMRPAFSPLDHSVSCFYRTPLLFEVPGAGHPPASDVRGPVWWPRSRAKVVAQGVQPAVTRAASDGALQLSPASERRSQWNSSE